MPDSFILRAIETPDAPKPSVFAEAAEQLPSAVQEWATDAWNNKAQFVEKTAINLGESGLVGGAISYLAPCRGKAALVIGAVMMAPAAYKVVRNLWDADQAAAEPGADTHKIGHKLAYDTVDGAYNLGVSFAGGYAGAEVGGIIGGSNTAAGAFSRSIRSNVFGVGRAPAGSAPELSTLLAPLKGADAGINVGPVKLAEVVGDGALTPQSIVAKDLPPGLDGSKTEAQFRPAPPIPEGPPGILTSLDGVPKSEVTVSGTITKVMANDTSGLPHQRFVVKLADGKNIFIANDTHYGTAVPDLAVGQPITIKGEWIPQQGNNGGIPTEGILHWTHKGDGPGLHQGGYIDYGGQRYQLIGPQELGADNVSGSSGVLNISPLSEVLAQTRPAEPMLAGMPLLKDGSNPSGADLQNLFQPERGHGGGNRGGGDRGGSGEAPPPVKDGPPGVLTSLEGVPRSEVTVAGKVSKLLADDNKGLPHQRFLMQLQDGSNVFIANDTHYGTFVPDLQVGNAIQIKGEWIPEAGSYDGTPTAGVLHWTHKGDAGSSHPGGWIDYGGNRYQLIDTTPIPEAPADAPK